MIVIDARRRLRRRRTLETGPTPDTELLAHPRADGLHGGERPEHDGQRRDPALVVEAEHVHALDVESPTVVGRARSSRTGA